LTYYWRTKNRSESEIDELLALAEEVLDVHVLKAGGRADETIVATEP
jgi:hypothetical protein